MSRLRVVPIVEGHGEQNAIRILLQRVWCELLGGEYIDVLQPIRRRRQRLATDKDGELSNAVSLAASKLSSTSTLDDPELILILVDADDDLPCVLGPQLLSTARNARTDCDIACVVANIQYETWFVAAPDSLSEFIDIVDADKISSPETERCGKGWIKKRFKHFKYSETVDQPKLTARMDLTVCRNRAPSFDKLCRELEKRLNPSKAG